MARLAAIGQQPAFDQLHMLNSKGVLQKAPTWEITASVHACQVGGLRNATSFYQVNVSSSDSSQRLRFLAQKS